MQASPSAFRSGDRIPESGIYRVCHEAHRLPEEVTLLGGQSFPVCSRCEEAVRFFLVRSASGMESAAGFRITLHELPVIEEPEAERLAS